MTELTVYLNPSSAQVSSAVEDINAIALTLTVANNQATAANLPTGLTIAFAVDPGDTGPTGMSGPTNALLFSNRTIDPEGGEAVQVRQLPTGVSSDPQWGIGLDQGNSDPTIVQFAVTPNGDGTIQPGASVTFAFSEVQVNMAWGTSTITVAVSPPGTDTIAASPQIQKTPVELLKPVLTALPPQLTPPSNEVNFSWSNTGANLCILSWDQTSTVVTYAGITRDHAGWSAPLLVTATAPVQATLLQSTGFTLHAQGGGLVGQPTDMWATASIGMLPPTLNAIAIPPTVSAVNPPGGDPAGGQEVAIIGTGFSGTTAVTFTPAGAGGSGGAAATNVIIISDTELAATTPAGTGAVGVTVAAPAGTSLVTPASQYCYTAAGQPVITGISPAYGDVAGGQPVTIYGTAFTAPATVTFTPPGAAAGGVVTGTVVSGSELTATTPAGTGIATADVTVTTPAGTSLASLASQYTYIAAGTPFVTGISPAYGIPGGGQPTAVTGTGLTQASAVTFTPVGGGASGLAATGIANDPTTPDSLLTATTPAGTGTVDVIVTTAPTATSPGGTSPATPADLFSYAPAVTPAAPVAPYQQFQLDWSSYTGSAPALTWGSNGPAAAVSDPQIAEPVTVTTASGSLGNGATLPAIAGSAIAAIGGPTFFELAYFAEASPVPVRIDLTMAPLALTGFDISGPAVQPDGGQIVTLTWTAANATAFVLVNSAGTINIPLPHYQRRCLAELPLSGPSLWIITAYGYDESGNPTSKTLWQPMEPLPVQVKSFAWWNQRITNAATGQQTVSLYWQADNATGFTITGAGDPLPQPPEARSADLNLPLPPTGQPGPTQFTLTITANGYVKPGISNTTSVDVYPFLLQPLSFTAAPTAIAKGDAVTLTWSAEYATGFTLDAGLFPANSSGTTVSPRVSTLFTLTAQGYTPGPRLPTATAWVQVKVKEDTDKHLPKENLPEQPRLIPGALLAEDAEPDPAGPEGQPTGQQPFIGQDERPDVGAHLRASRPPDS